MIVLHLNPQKLRKNLVLGIVADQKQSHALHTTDLEVTRMTLDELETRMNGQGRNVRYLTELHHGQTKGQEQHSEEWRRF